MPRFFFHFHDGDAHDIDSDGLEFPSLEHALSDVRQAAREMLEERLIAGDPIDGQRFDVADEDGRVLETVTFKSMLNGS
ncbi:hypothetical protein WMC41_29400 (plasmid) [Shinella yambaruensis]|uniref:DUF6894 family protein n=1 Tax=Shinella yambaruensis TaxID=415996 RepID=UPI003D79F199